jgi:uncharacterized protein (TIGR03437 family)
MAGHDGAGWLGGRSGCQCRLGRRESRRAKRCGASGTGSPQSQNRLPADFDAAAMQVPPERPFAAHAVVPLTLASGLHTIPVQSGYGMSRQQVTRAAVAPAIFLIGNEEQGAVTDHNYQIVSASNPASQGKALVLSATGRGGMTQNGRFCRPAGPAGLKRNDLGVTPDFAGLAPGHPGLYQVKDTVPAGMAPEPGLPLAIETAGVTDNTVRVAVEQPGNRMRRYETIDAGQGNVVKSALIAKMLGLCPLTHRDPVVG